MKRRTALQQPLKYFVKEIFGPTIQGEGFLIGVPVLFLRFVGCNMWSGLEKDRMNSPCHFCDTDFVGGRPMTAEDIVTKLHSKNFTKTIDWVVVTGGEPLLQLTANLVDALHVGGYKVNLETNGTIPCDFEDKIDHISMSPKTLRAGIKINRVDSLKILHRNEEAPLEEYKDFPAKHKFIQPIHGLNGELVSLPYALKELYLLGGEWRLSPQLHKLLGIE